MIIEKLEIGSFGRLDNMVLNLTSGVNIIRGGNESGKSTICNFIVFIFYGLPTKLDDKMKYISWKTSTARGAVTILNDDGKRYRIEREAICQSTGDGKIAFRERCNVIDTETNAVVGKGITPGELFFGVPDSIFADTVYIKQVNGTKIGDKNLSESAENILFAGNESINTKKALKKLDDARVYLWHKNKKGGQIYDLEAQSEDLRERLEAAMQSSTRVIYLEGMHRQLSDSYANAEKRSAEFKEELDLYESYTICSEYQRYKDELQKKKKTEDEQDEFCKAVPFNNEPVYSEPYISGLETMKSQLEAATVRSEEASAALDKAKKHMADVTEKVEVFDKFGTKHGKRDSMVAEADELSEKLRGYNAIRKASLIFFAIFAVITLVVFFLSLMKVIPNDNGFGNAPFITGIVLTCLGLILFIAMTFIRSKPAQRLKKICRTFGCHNYAEFDEMVRAASKDDAILNYINDECESAEEAYVAASAALDKTNNEIVAHLKAANFAIEKTTIYSLEQAIQTCKKQKATLDEMKAKISESNIRIFEIQKAFNSYSEEYISQACAIEYDVEKMESYDYQAKKREYEFLLNSIKAQNDKIHEIEKELATLKATEENPTELADKLKETDWETDNLKEKYDAYQLAFDAMTTASGKLREGLAPKIAKNAGVIMNKLSAGKYTSLGVNSEFEMTFRDDTISRSVDYLSAGTSDIAYISLRIALIDILFRKSIPPFIFDESFMRMDNDRMKHSLELLCEFGENGTQSMLFTCHGREEKLMKTIGEYTYYTI